MGLGCLSSGPAENQHYLQKGTQKELIPPLSFPAKYVFWGGEFPPATQAPGTPPTPVVSAVSAAGVGPRPGLPLRTAAPCARARCAAARHATAPQKKRLGQDGLGLWSWTSKCSFCRCGKGLGKKTPVIGRCQIQLVLKVQVGLSFLWVSLVSVWKGNPKPSGLCFSQRRSLCRSSCVVTDRLRQLTRKNMCGFPLAVGFSKRVLDKQQHIRMILVSDRQFKYRSARSGCPRV